MKKRTGFVSNSSSSSFIIGVGVCTDDTAINKLKTMKDYELEIMPISEVLEGCHNGWSSKYSAGSDSYCVESFTYSVVTIDDLVESYQKNPDSVVVRYATSEGDDSDFSVYDDDGDFVDYDYDIDIDFFSESTQATVTTCSELCDEFNYDYGAGRDG